MTTPFFNNIEHPLIEKIHEISQNMANFDQFCAVVGYFSASGYLKIRQELEHVPLIRILIGIQIEKIFEHLDRMFSKLDTIVNDINKGARYSEDVTYVKKLLWNDISGIFLLWADIKSGKLNLRVYNKNILHAKFYLCLPSDHYEHTDGCVIIGSSNLSMQGLGLTQPTRYELNVALKHYEYVKYCRDEFEKLWFEAVDIRETDVRQPLLKLLEFFQNVDREYIRGTDALLKFLENVDREYNEILRKPDEISKTKKEDRCFEAKFLQNSFRKRPLLSHNFSEQRKLSICNGFRHFWYEIIVKNFV